MITTIGQYAGAAVGVVALAYAAGAQSSGGDPSDDSGSSGAPSSASAVGPLGAAGSALDGAARAFGVPPRRPAKCGGQCCAVM